jgi:hypothetical protein
MTIYLLILSYSENNVYICIPLVLYKLIYLILIQ